ncbi:hypothetical protein [Actinoplanes sp. NPDC026670]|uniref:hypothetical protein n=1 Tax=Actinoplanes sp. NPDC026670 TaxID=3154700 RepID=UPI0033D04294
MSQRTADSSKKDQPLALLGLTADVVGLVVAAVVGLRVFLFAVGISALVLSAWLLWKQWGRLVGRATLMVSATMSVGLALTVGVAVYSVTHKGDGDLESEATPRNAASSASESPVGLNSAPGSPKALTSLNARWLEGVLKPGTFTSTLIKGAGQAGEDAIRITFTEPKKNFVELYFELPQPENWSTHTLACAVRLSDLKNISGASGIAFKDMGFRQDLGPNVPLDAKQDGWVELTATVGRSHEPDVRKPGKRMLYENSFTGDQIKGFAIYFDVPEGGAIEGKLVYVSHCSYT